MIPLVKGQNNSKNGYRDELPINMTAIADNIKGDTGYLLAHDGLTEFCQTSGIARGGVYNERFSKHFRVSGNYLEAIDPDGTLTQIGVIDGTGVCQFAASFNTQAIVARGRLWLYDNSSLVRVSDSDLGVPIDITWFRGIYVMTDGEFLFHTDITDEYSISPLKYTSSEFAADPIVGVMRTDQNQIIAFNRYSTEYFYFNAAAPSGTSVLQSIEGKSSRIGIVGTNCKAMLDGEIFVLGGRKNESPSIHIMNGGAEVTVATREIDKIISKYNDSQLETVYMESRTVDRDKFLIIHLPDYTLLFNHTTAKKYGIDSAWSYVSSGDSATWRARYGVHDPRVNKWIYGDNLESKLGYLDGSTFSQYGEPQEAIFYSPIIPMESASINSIELDTIPGYALTEFTTAFSMSYDGTTFGREYWNMISAPDNYTKRYIARRLGYIRNDVSFKFRFISTDKMAFSGFNIDAS